MISRYAPLLVLTPLATALPQNVPHTSRIVGIVIDSIHQSGLAGAEVLVSGIPNPVITDAQGRFVVDSLAPGTYQVGVFHPLLESLGMTLSTKPFTVGPDSTGVANLAIPAAATIAARNCPGQATPDHPAVVMGRVEDPDTDDPVPDVTVSLSWVDMVVSKETGVVRTPHELHTSTNKSGVFKFCGLPMDLDATVQANLGKVWTGEVAVSTSGAPLTFENLAIASNSEKAKTGIVRGTVTGLDDHPVAGARVEAPMTGAAIVTKEDGSFELPEIPTGTQLLVVRHLGFEPARVAVNVTSRQPTILNVVLGPRVNVMDPVLVNARLNYALEKTGFAQRQRAGWGHYFTHDEIEKRNPAYVSDLITEIPGLRVVHGVGGATIVDERHTSILGGGRGNCVRVYVDGTEWRAVEAGDVDLFVSPHEIAGMEVYRPGSAPVQFRGVNDQCVTLVVWTETEREATAR